MSLACARLRIFDAFILRAALSWARSRRKRGGKEIESLRGAANLSSTPKRA
jgi:hypothetical protein